MLLAFLTLGPAVLCGSAAGSAAESMAGPWLVSADRIVVGQAVLIRGSVRGIDFQPHMETPPLTLTINGETLTLWRDLVCQWERDLDGSHAVTFDLQYDFSHRRWLFSEPGRYEVEIGNPATGEVLFSCTVDVAAPRDEDEPALRLLESVESLLLLLADDPHGRNPGDLERLVEQFPDCPWRRHADAALGSYYVAQAQTPADPGVEAFKAIPEKVAALAGHFRAAAADETLGLACWRARLRLAECLTRGKELDEARQLLATVAGANLPGLSTMARQRITGMDAMAWEQRLATAGMDAFDRPTAVGGPIEHGFVFIDGAYLPPPYRISRKGLALLINDVEVQGFTPSVDSRALAFGLHYRGQQRREYEQGLQQDWCYFIASGAADVALDPHSAAFQLPDMIEALRSDRSVEEKVLELERCGWRYSAGRDKLAALATGFSAPPELDMRLEALARRLLRAEELGRTDGPPVDKGFVFFEGRYLEAPYIVSRNGLGVLVNGELVSRPRGRLGRGESPGEVDPLLPEEVTRETSPHNDVLRVYLSDKYAYARAHFAPEGERDFMEKTIRALPCVQEARLDEKRPMVLHVTSFSGERCEFPLLSVRRETAAKADDASLRHANSVRESLERDLSRGDALFLGRMACTTVPSASVPQDLPAILAILKTSDTEDAKIAKLQSTALRDFPPEAMAQLITAFTGSEQLEQRLSALNASAGPREQGRD